MKNGKTIRRCYPYTTREESEASLRVYETDWSRELLAQALAADPEMPAEDDPSRFSADAHYCYGYASGSVSIGHGCSWTPLELTHEQHTALKEALARDLSTQTAADRFTPAHVDGHLLFKDSTAPSDDVWGTPKGLYPLTEHMAYTRAFLTENGLMALMPPVPEPTGPIYLLNIASRTEPDRYDEYSIRDLHFESEPFQLPPDGEMVYSFGHDQPAKQLTAEQYQAVKDHLFSAYYAGDTGYIVLVGLDGERACSYYLPERYATPEIRALFGA